MSDFFTRMVERTLGRSGVVQPFVPPAFSRSSIRKDYRYPPQASTEEAPDGEGRSAGSIQLHNITPSLLVYRPGSASDGGYNSGNLPASGYNEKSVKDSNSLKNNPEKSGIDRPAVDPVLNTEKEETLLPPVTIKQSVYNNQLPNAYINVVGEEHQNVLTKHKSTAVSGFLPSKGTSVTDVSGISERPGKSLSSKKKTGRVDTSSPAAVSAAAERETSMRDKDSINKREYSVPAMVKRAVHPVTPVMDNQINPAASEKFSARNESSSMPPIVKVTIGRIDVRAVMQQPASPKHTVVPAPKLSLDDYLKQRSGGQR